MLKTIFDFKIFQFPFWIYNFDTDAIRELEISRKRERIFDVNNGSWH